MCKFPGSNDQKYSICFSLGIQRQGQFHNIIQNVCNASVAFNNKL